MRKQVEVWNNGFTCDDCGEDSNVKSYVYIYGDLTLCRTCFENREVNAAIDAAKEAV